MVDWSRGHNSSSAMEQMLDAENKRMTENLSSKVSRLKSLALDIDKDTEDQNRYLDGMPGAEGCRWQQIPGGWMPWKRHRGATVFPHQDLRVTRDPA
ncbi:BET1-like protein isoform X4 [Latimeria chalumnae]|uniref:BET1-like protein isoform X4 n=1 Tax=Latimeria chalumnae TaxID=7897 RepID=UPI00313ADA85